MIIIKFRENFKKALFYLDIQKAMLTLNVLINNILNTFA